MSLLEIKNLHVEIESEGEGKQILNGLNLTVEKGQVAAIMGPNGSGKSTLAYVLAGKPGYAVTEGEVLLELGCPNLRLLREYGVEASLASLDLVVERAHRPPHPHVGGDRNRGGDAGDYGGSDCGVGHGIRLGAP